MSLLMLKTKNLSWQDHTLNIEVMLAPLRSTLLLNKHKTLDTKYEKEKALYERQRDACVKDYVVEKRLIERRRQKILNRKKEVQAEARSKSALEHGPDVIAQEKAANQGRSSSAPLEGRSRPEAETPNKEQFQPTLPRLSLRHTPLFGGSLLRPRMFLETGPACSNTATSSESDGQSDHGAGPKKPTTVASVGFFVTGDGQLRRRTSMQSSKVASTNRNRPGKSPQRTRLPPTITKTPASPQRDPKARLPPQAPPPPKTMKTTTTTDASRPDRGVPRRVPNVTFLDLLDQENDFEDDDDEYDENGNVMVEVKQKTVEDKVRDFLRELDAFNSRPPTACSMNTDSIFSSTRSRESERAVLVANRYHNLALDKKALEKAFDRYCERRTHDDLLKAMKLASKMKAHIRQARNTSLVPTMAAFKSSRTFMKLLKRQQRRDKQTHEN